MDDLLVKFKFLYSFSSGTFIQGLQEEADLRVQSVPT